MKYILLLLVVLWSMQVHATTGPGLPADSVAATLTTLPAFRNLKLSPDGKRVLMLRARGETYHLTVLDTVARTNKLLLASDPEQFLFEWCSWANNERIVCSIRIDKVLNLAGYGKKQLRTEFTRLVAINADGTGYLQLVPEQKHSGNYRDSGWMSRVQSDIVSWLPDDDEHILLSLIRKDPFFPDVYKLNIYTNRMKLDTRHRSGILEWLADRQDRVRLGMGIEDGNLRVIVRDGDSSRFTERTPGFLLTDPEPGFAGFAEQEDQVYLFSNNGEDKSALWLFDLKTQRMVRKLLADDRYDVRGPLYTSERGRPLMMVRRREGAELYWFDHKLEAAFNEVAAALPGEKTLPVSVSAELDSLILKNSGEKMPDTYYYYDVARQQLIRIGADYDVAAGQLPERTIYSYKASDGLEIQAYLTLPLQGQGGLPTVIMPHGGPHARDTADFDYLSIVFAAAGYAVLQPDYRGSAGYGQRFRAAGYGQWGKRMQQDVLDGLDALIAEGITNPERVCVVGASYGGYVAQVATYQSPQKFRCAVSFGGVADIERIALHWRKSVLGRLAVATLTNGVSWDEMISRSPLSNVADMEIPLLLIHGDADSVVAVDHSNLLAEQLELHGKTFRYVVQDGGDHYLSRQSHRTQFFTESLQFLERYIGDNGDATGNAPVN